MEELKEQLALVVIQVELQYLDSFHLQHTRFKLQE